MEIKYRFWMTKLNEYFSWERIMGYCPEQLYDYLSETRESVLVREQYTGIKDKNGTEIYVGDVFKIKHGYNWKKESYFEVVFSRSFGYILRNENGDWFPLKDKAKEYEVIGNIHEKGGRLNV